MAVVAGGAIEVNTRCGVTDFTNTVIGVVAVGIGVRTSPGKENDVLVTRVGGRQRAADQCQISETVCFVARSTGTAEVKQSIAIDIYVLFPKIFRGLVVGIIVVSVVYSIVYAGIVWNILGCIGGIFHIGAGGGQEEHQKQKKTSELAKMGDVGPCEHDSSIGKQGI